MHVESGNEDIQKIILHLNHPHESWENHCVVYCIKGWPWSEKISVQSHAFMTFSNALLQNYVYPQCRAISLSKELKKNPETPLAPRVCLHVARCCLIIILQCSFRIGWLYSYRIIQLWCHPFVITAKSLCLAKSNPCFCLFASIQVGDVIDWALGPKMAAYSCAIGWSLTSVLTSV